MTDNPTRTIPVEYGRPLPGAVASAEPKPDREPRRATCTEHGCEHPASGDLPFCLEHAPPEPPPEPERVLDPSRHDPAAVATWAKGQEEEARRNRAGAMRVNVVGVDESGKIPNGAEDWYYREPRAHMDALHTDPIVVNGKLMFQQPPPVHSRTVPPGSPSTHKTVARELSETEAQRRCLAGALENVPPEVTGFTERQLKRQAAKRRRRR